MTKNKTQSHQDIHEALFHSHAFLFEQEDSPYELRKALYQSLCCFIDLICEIFPDPQGIYMEQKFTSDIKIIK